MESWDRWSVDGLLGGFDEHLRRTRGVCAGTRRNYTKFVRAFLAGVSDGGVVDVSAIAPAQVFEYVGVVTCTYRPRTVEGAATSLRSFFGFCAWRA